MHLLAIAAIVLVEAVAAWLAFQSTRAGETSFWLLAGAPSVAIAVAALIRPRRRWDLREWFRPRAGDFTVGVLAGAIVFGGAYAFSRAVTPPGSTREMWLVRLYLQLGDPDTLRAHSAILFAGLITVAAAEEIVWRGLVMDLFAERFGSRIAWILQAVAYAAAFVPTMVALAPAPGQLNPILVVAALGAGLVWGLVVRRMGRLPPAIVAHALFDWCVVVMFRLWGVSV